MSTEKWTGERLIQGTNVCLINVKLWNRDQVTIPTALLRELLKAAGWVRVA
jgi:hypothetical protein